MSGFTIENIEGYTVYIDQETGERFVRKALWKQFDDRKKKAIPEATTTTEPSPAKGDGDDGFTAVVKKSKKKKEKPAKKSEVEQQPQPAKKSEVEQQPQPAKKSEVEQQQQPAKKSEVEQQQQPAKATAKAKTDKMNFAGAAGGSKEEEFEFTDEELNIEPDLAAIFAWKAEEDAELIKRKQAEEAKHAKKREEAKVKAKREKLIATLKEKEFSDADIQLYLQKITQKKAQAVEESPPARPNVAKPTARPDAAKPTAQPVAAEPENKEGEWKTVRRDLEELCTNSDCDCNGTCPYNHPDTSFCKFDCKGQRCNRINCDNNHRSGKVGYVEKTLKALSELSREYGADGTFLMEKYEEGGKDNDHTPYNHYNDFKVIKRIDIDQIKHRCAHDAPWKKNPDGTPRRCFNMKCSWDHFAGHTEYCIKAN
jgi:hypothetical protein